MLPPDVTDVVDINHVPNLDTSIRLMPLST